MRVATPAGFQLRRLHPSDSLSELTDLLHRAYEPLAQAGMRYVASWQDDETTRRRIANGECFVGIVGGRLVATITFHDPTASGGAEWYDRPDVAAFHQFCVDPSLQGMGIGSLLLSTVETRAVETGAAELACDTAENATHLIGMYSKRGYRPVERVDWEATNYESVILSKTL